MRISDWSADVCSSDLRRAVDIEGDALAVDRRDHALQPAAPVLWQLQADLGALADEPREPLRREQRAIDAGRRHFQGVVAADRILDVELCRHLAADRLAVLDA